MLPFEFIVVGVPVSHQASDRRRLAAWRQIIRDVAWRYWPAPHLPLDDQLKITVVYYHEGVATRLDNDNLLKPIQDALNGVIYHDDRQIVDTQVRKTSIDGQFYVRGISSILAEGFVRGEGFVHIRIETAPNHAELL
jgi:Holliday junction resolvase RusA-like endonuclease